MRRRRRKVGGSHVEGLSIRYLTAHCTKNQCTMQCTMQHYAMCYAMCYASMQRNSMCCGNSLHSQPVKWKSVEAHKHAHWHPL